MDIYSYVVTLVKIIVPHKPTALLNLQGLLAGKGKSVIRRDSEELEPPDANFLRRVSLQPDNFIHDVALGMYGKMSSPGRIFTFS